MYLAQMFKIVQSTLNLQIVTLAVFELRKNKWLFHGQPGYNFWLYVQVFGCP